MIRRARAGRRYDSPEVEGYTVEEGEKMVPPRNAEGKIVPEPDWRFEWPEGRARRVYTAAVPFWMPCAPRGVGS